MAPSADLKQHLWPSLITVIEVRSRDVEFCSLIGPRFFYQMVEKNKKEDRNGDDSFMVNPLVQIIKCQMNL